MELTRFTRYQQIFLERNQSFAVQQKFAMIKKSLIVPSSQAASNTVFQKYFVISSYPTIYSIALSNFYAFVHR